MKDLESRKPLLGGNGKSPSRYALAALVGSLLLLVGICTPNFVTQEKETSVSDAEQAWPSKFSNIEMGVGMTGEEAQKELEAMMEEQEGFKKPAYDNEPVTEHEEAPDKLEPGKLYLSEDACKTYLKQFSGHEPCKCEKSGGQAASYFFGFPKDTYICKSECSAHKSVKDCDGDAKCIARPGKAFWYCAMKSECYKTKMTDAALALLNTKSDKFPADPRSDKFITKTNCVNTCPWEDNFQVCMPEGLDALKAFDKSFGWSKAYGKAEEQQKALQEKLQKTVCKGNAECENKLQAVVNFIIDWYMLKKTGQCRLDKVTFGSGHTNNNPCPTGTDRCTWDVDGKGVCSDVSHWREKCVILRVAGGLALVGMNEAEDIKKLHEAQEIANTAFEILEMTADALLDGKEAGENAEGTSKRKLLEEAEHADMAVVKDSLAEFRTKVSDAATQKKILNYAETQTAKRMVQHVVNILGGALAQTIEKSGFMAVHAKMAVVAAHDLTGTTAAVWAAIGTANAGATNWAKQHLIIEMCPKPETEFAKLLGELVAELAK